MLELTICMWTGQIRHHFQIAISQFMPRYMSDMSHIFVCMQVLRYLQKFDQAFGISPMVQFNTRVVEATPLQLSSGPHESSLGPQWRLKLEPANAVQSSTEHQVSLLIKHITQIIARKILLARLQ